VRDHAGHQPCDRTRCHFYGEVSPMMRMARAVLARMALVVFLVAVGVFFALPMAWLVVAPFDGAPSMSIRWPDWTLGNLRTLLDNPYALRSIGNSLLLAGGTMA